MVPICCPFPKRAGALAHPSGVGVRDAAAGAKPKRFGWRLLSRALLPAPRPAIGPSSFGTAPHCSEGDSPELKRKDRKKMFGQQINTEAQTREEMFLRAILDGSLRDPEVDDATALAIADAIISKALLN